MNWKPGISVAAIVEQAGRFLCVEELIDGRRVINQPAGHVEHGEDFLAAAVRETLEETAWHFRPESFLGVYTSYSPDGSRSMLRFAICGSVHRHEPDRPLDTPIIAAHWLTREQLLGPSLTLRTPMVLRCVDDYLAGRRLPLEALGAAMSG